MATPTPTPKPVPTAAPARPAGVTPIKPAAAGQAPAQAKQSAKSRLGMVKRGKLRIPLRHLFYGPEGVGKTSLAADAGNVLFLDIEGGSAKVDALRYRFRDEDENTDHVPRSYDEVLEALYDLINNPDHGYTALVIDTVDALEALIHKWICKRDEKSGIEDYGYGKGYRVALDEFRRFLALVDQARAKAKMDVIVLGHSDVVPFKNPEGEDYDRYQLRMHKLAAGQLKEWCEVVGFVHFEGGGAKIKGDTAQTKRARGWSTGRRLIELQRTAAWDAKCRLNLPPTLELAVAHPWRPFAAARDMSDDATIEQMMREAYDEVERITGIGGEDPESDPTFVTPTGATTSRLVVMRLVAERNLDTLARILPGLKATDSIVTTATEET